MASVPKSSSSIPVDTTEMRYQKAIKEITKLISINNELKDQGKKNSQLIESLKNEIKEVTYQLQKINQEKQELEVHLDQLTIKYRDLQEDFVQVDKKKRQKKEKIYKEIFHSNDIENIRSSNESELYFKKIAELQERNNYLEGKVDEGQKHNEMKIKQKIAENLELKRNIRELEENFTEWKNQSGKNRVASFQFSDHQLNEMSKDQIIKKFKILYFWNQNTSQQCVQLKTKILNYETQSNMVTRIKSQKALQLINSPQNMLQDHYSHKSDSEVAKRLKVVEEQKKAIAKKYQAVKTRLEGIDSQFNQIAKQNERNHRIIEGYEKLIEKQQNQIENLVMEYERDMKKITQDFKDRLVEQRQNFGPGKSNKQIKMIQILQTENKSLKKKFQMCSSELTKCFRYLQTYKQKLAQYESSCNELINENAKLTEKIAALTNRQESPSKPKKKTTLNAQKVETFGDESPIKIKE